MPRPAGQATVQPTSGRRRTPATRPCRCCATPRCGPAVVAQFHQLPPYQALLTVGPEAIYQLPTPLHEKLIALDCGARQARLVRATMAAADTLALEGTAKAVKGALRARGYGIGGDLVAEPQVLREILRNAGASGRAGARGGPMQLFERWVALAVPTGATDLHVEVSRNTGVVRIRVDGRMEALPDGQGGRYSRKGRGRRDRRGLQQHAQGQQRFPVQRRSVRRLHDRSRPARHGGPAALPEREGPAGPEDGGAHPAHRRRQPHPLRRKRATRRVTCACCAWPAARARASCCSPASPARASPPASRASSRPCPDSTRRPSTRWRIRSSTRLPARHQIEVLRDIANDDETRRRYAEVMRALMRSDPDGGDARRRSATS